MKKIIILLLSAISVSAFAQTDEISNKLKEYNISGDILTSNLKDADAEYSFDLKTATDNGTETKIETAKFDATKEIGERWILVSVNGQSPSKKDLKTFDKTHNTKKDDVNGEVDNNSWKIEKDDNDFLVISFQYDKSTMPKKYAYLADCKGYAFFNKNTKEFVRAEFVNEGPLKIKIFNIRNLDMVVDYTFLEGDGKYLMKVETLDMETRILGQPVKIREVSEYSNYKKIG
jgi:hypothetical protein